MITIDLPVLGMTCAACVGRVERAIGAIEGVTAAEVNLLASRARVTLDGASGATISGVAAAIRAAGYEVPADVVDMIASDGGGNGAGAGARRLAAIEAAEHAESGALRRDAWIASALAVPLIAIAMFGGAIPPRASLPIQLVLGTLVMFGPGRRYLRAGAAALGARSPDMNTLIALGAGAAWASSTVRAVMWLARAGAPPPELYFEAAAAIVAFVMIGKVLEARARARVSDAVRGLLSLAPARAHRIADDNTETDLDAAALVAGDTILIRPGERLPADGTVIAGSSAVDESMLTGEGVPVDKAEGSPAYAGTLNQQGALTVRVARAGADTAIARIARAVEDAQGGKAPIARLADRVAAWFVPAVLAIAAATFAIWVIAGAGGWIALERAIAVLVIACPCALGLATPAAVAVGTARGAALGVLYAGGAALEIASAIDTVCVDKTGTLTAGAPALVGVVPRGAANLDEDALLRFAASAERASEHPIARAICAGAAARGLVLATARELIVEPGAGLAAIVDDRSIRVGTRDYLALAGVDTSAADADATALAAAGRTVSYVAIDGALAGLVAVADPPAPDARAAIAALRALGLDVVMITGDRDGAARWIADAVGITRVHAEVRPTGKAALVAAERAAGHRVAMVGDGLNDAPAIAAADLGVALAHGADLTAAVADVTLLRGGIAALPTALGLARATLHAIRRNLIAAFAYNAVCIPVAAGALYPLTGWLLSPMLAAAAMSLSSVSVLLASLRLRSWSPPAARAHA